MTHDPQHGSTHGGPSSTHDRLGSTHDRSGSTHDRSGSTHDRSEEGLLNLQGRRALVTGAGRGIGRACAEALARAGAEVTLLSRTASDLTEVAADIAGGGGVADVLVCDCTDRAAVAERLSSAPGHWDVLVNNAGTNRPMPFLEVGEEDYEAVMALNVKAAFFVAQAAAAKMVDAGARGSIINMSSQMGHVGGRRRSLYCASKHALEGMTKAMALDLAPHGIRVNTVCPTFVLTPMTAPFFEDEDFRADTLERIPLGRLADVEDVTGAVVFLASDAAAMITGSAIKIDGGWTAV